MRARLRMGRAIGTGFLALGLSAGLGACGGEDEDSPRLGDEAQVRALGERFTQILAAEDAKAFCRVLAPNDRLRLAEPGSDGMKECLVVWGKDRNPLFGAKDPDLEIENVSFDGAYATAKLANGGELGFANEEGRWYVHLAPASAQAQESGS